MSKERRLKRLVDRNLRRYHIAANEIVALYHNLCMEWEDKDIPNYKDVIINACDKRWQLYVQKNYFRYPRPKADYLTELLKLTK